MKAYEINNIANAAIANLMMQGYAINVLNDMHRTDSIILVKRNGSKQDVRMVKIEDGNERSYENRYDLDTLSVNVYEYNGMDANFQGVLWEDRADNTVEVAKFYTAKSWGRDKWYTGKEEAIERQRLREEIRQTRRSYSKQTEISTERMSDSMLDKIRSVRGFKRANRENTKIVKRNGSYVISFEFTDRTMSVSKRGIAY